MKCKLCNKEKNLLKRSHIIPDFMYKGLFDEKHFIAPIDLVEFKREKLLPNGFYDSNILCKSCDNEVLGALESYSSTVLWGGVGHQNSYLSIEKKLNLRNQRFLRLANLDYTKFKLFLLSILWRASISRHKIFDTVSLGDHENKIRKMIFDNHPGESGDYPVGMFLLTENKDVPVKMISNPIKLKMGNNLSYLFLINRLVIYFKIEGQDDKEFYNHIRMEKNNTMDVYLFDKKDSVKFLDNFLGTKLRYKRR